MSNELHLDEFEILSFKEDQDGAYLYDVIPVKDRVECPYCKSLDIIKHGSFDRFVHDLPAYGHPVYITILSNRFRCSECGKTFVNEYESIDIRAKVTKRLREHIKKECLRKTLADIQRDYSISNTLTNSYCKEVIAEGDAKRVLYSPRILGIDELFLNKKMCGVFTDVEKRGIIEILSGRKNRK